MPSRYWVGGTATWDGTAGTKWATTSGGAGGAAVPTAADDVFFDGNSGSGTITLATGQSCLTLDFTGFTGTFAHNSNVALTVAGNLYRLSAGMTFSTTASGTTARIDFTSTSGTCLITTAGKSMCSMTFNGVGGTFQLQDALTTLSTHTVTLTNGTLDTNGQTCSWGLFSSSNSNTRVLTLGASTISLTGTGTITPWNCQTSTNMTLNAGTSTLSFATSGQAPTMQGGGLTYYNLSITNTSGGFTLGQSNTFNNITYAQGAGNRTFTLGTSTTQTVNGVLTLTGFNVNQSRLRVQSNTFGTQCTFALGTTGTVAITNVDFSDIAFTGTNAPVSGTSLGDIGGNSGITFTPARTVYWVGGTGNMADTTSWSLTSGGASGAAVPLCQDTAIFDANSFSAPGQTVSQNIFRCGTIDFSAATNNPTWSFLNSSGAGLLICGDLTLAPGMTTTAASAAGGTCAVTMAGRGSQTITSNSVALGTGVSLEINSVGGTYTLQDSLVMSDTGRTLTCTRGTFNANGYNVTCGLFSSSNSNTRTITMGSGTWTLTGTGTVWNVGTTPGLTMTATSSTIVISDTSSALKTFSSGTAAAAYGTVTITPGGTGPLTFNSNNKSFVTLNVTGSKTVIFAPSTTYTVTNLNITSSKSQPVTFLSSTPGTQYTLSVASGTVGSRYMSIFDCIGTGGATFVARESYGNNTTGWTIVPPRRNLALADSNYAVRYTNTAGQQIVSSVNSGIGSNGSYSLLSFVNLAELTGSTEYHFGIAASPTNQALNISSSGFFGHADPVGVVTSTMRAVPGMWYSQVVTWDSTNSRSCLYVNGYLISTRTGTATSFTDGVIVAGRFPFSDTFRISGSHRKLRVFGRELTAAEVMAWSQDGTEPSTSLATWNLSEGTGTSVADSSGNGRTGTLTGAAWVTNRPVTARSQAANRVASPVTNRNAASNRVQL